MPPKKSGKGRGRTVSMNIRIRELDNTFQGPNRILNAIAKLRGTTKEEIVKQALIEFAHNHTPELGGEVPVGA